ncbi:MAG: hypothetical protein PF904_13115 [Kiritimatiellae bacterium]|jgi:hypothetical protein|nr:hypothetical protein [Kiritimatiellia bacterium]
MSEMECVDVGFMQIYIYTAIILLTAYPVFAADFVEQFESASAKRCSPGVEVDFSAFSFGKTIIDQKLAHISEAGFNSVLLKSVPSTSNSWQTITAVAGQCRRHSMKLGCSFFSGQSLEDGSCRQLRKLGWSRRTVDIHDLIENRSPVYMSDRIEVSSVAGVLVPASSNAEYSAVGNVVLGRDSLPEQGIWHVFEFFADPVQPLVVDYLYQNTFTSSANEFLLAAQQQLDRNYGVVFNWVRFSSLSNSELVWTDDMDHWFMEKAGLDLIHNLPVLAGVDVKSAAHSQVVRQRYQQGIKKIWRERFAMNVKSLIQEAGLNAEIQIDEIPFDPEEIGSYFGITLVNAESNTQARVRNRRAAGGARVFEGKNITGRIDSSGEQTLKSAVNSLIIDGADNILFDEQILNFKGDADFANINDLMDYIRRIQFVLRNSKEESRFLLCSRSIPEILNQYSFDNVNLMMLLRAEVAERRLHFASDSRYSTVVFSEDQLSSEQGKELALDLKSKGVRVLFLRVKENVEGERLTKLMKAMGITEFGAIRNLPELLPDLIWRSDQPLVNIRFVHRSDAKRDFYLIRNESEAAGMVTLTFNMGAFKRVSRWQPQDGKIYEISKFARVDKLHVSIPTLVRPGEMFFMVFQ